MQFTKQLPIVPFESFIELAAKVKNFTSSQGKRYEVLTMNGTIMNFIRIDANQNKEWSFDLKDVYRAYMELQRFNTQDFKKYVPIRHSPARGLLLHLNLLK